MSKFYITTPIYYVNDVPHLGHAYTTIVADVLARYHRILANQVFFLVGTDEHGEKIQEAALRNKKTPQRFCDEKAAAFNAAWKALNIKYDNFIRTTAKNHIKAVEVAISKLYQDGYIYKGEYEALYCVGCEQYKMKSDLIDGKCPEHNRKPKILTEEAYLFKLSSFEKKIYNAISRDELQIEPKVRKNEILSFLKKEDLKDIAISRKKQKVSWGITLPFDKNYTLYKLFDWHQLERKLKNTGILAS